MKRQDFWGEILKIFSIVLLLFSLLGLYPSAEGRSARFNTSARSATLYVPETDSFIYSKNQNERLPMASTTKIMTAMIALEECEGDEVVVIGGESVGIEGSSAYLREGDELTMEELTYALLLQSANDAAVAIAYHIGGSVEAFADMMNKRARDMGLSDTNFENPHGLDSSEHYTTAHDLAKIAAAALENPKFKEIASTYKKSFVTEERSRTYVNHNKLLNMYDGCIGVKTGFTKKSGRCLVGAAERDGLTFITVTLDAPSDWADHKAMLNYGYERLEKINLAEPSEYEYNIPVLDGESESVCVKNIDGANLIRERCDDGFESHVKLSRFAVAPIREGDILGEVIFTIGGKECARVNLVATESVNKKNSKTLWERITSLF
ncbi:MAG: D-alanyl-D-alanine carboxypeptidase [Ruminococcaceae bacterium]|nr:D-alanyl-D-alanine carboxypeptidase [Oscillospiraceae bacterium]